MEVYLVGAGLASPLSSVLSSLNKPAASLMRLNSIQKAWTSMKRSCKMKSATKRMQPSRDNKLSHLYVSSSHSSQNSPNGISILCSKFYLLWCFVAFLQIHRKWSFLSPLFPAKISALMNQHIINRAKTDSSPVVSLEKGEKREGWWEGASRFSPFSRETTGDESGAKKLHSCLG